MPFVQNVCGNISGILIGIMAVGILLLILQNSRLKKQEQVVMRDTVTGAMSEIGFRLKAKKLLKSKIGQFAVVSMQISNLSQIICSFGVDSGKYILRRMIAALTQQLSGDECMAKTGEDSFCFLLKNSRIDDICIRLNRICTAIDEDGEKCNKPYSLQLLFGICVSEESETSIDVLLDRAQIARHIMPENQKYNFFDATEMIKFEQDGLLAESIDQALQTGEFVVFYQPMIQLSDMKVVGAEALIRWRHPRHGLMSPDMFLNVAERYGKARLINRFVVRQVCQTLARWKRQKRELCHIFVDLTEEEDIIGFINECEEICRYYEVEPSYIEFEIKEGNLLENREKSISLINRMHVLGFRCTVDNFGAEHISLQLLSKLDIDTVKLDGSFFTGDHNNRRGRYIVEAILKLCTQLRVQIVAEGIDSPGQLRFLQQAACDMVQGFCFFKPMALEIFEDEAYNGNVLRYVTNCLNDENEEHQSVTINQPAQITKSIVLFSWNTREDTVEFSDCFSPILGNKRKFENAHALFHTSELVHENDREDFFNLLERCGREPGWNENTLRFYVGEDRYGWLELRMRQEDCIGGGIISGTMINIAEWKKEVERWKEKATRDALTGLYNRACFENNVISRLEQKSFASAAILFIDVDDFKQVNDTLGHRVGDDVLCYVAKKILGVFRHTDIIARYGGDEFVVFAPYIQQDVLEDRLKKLCCTFKYPYRNNTIEYKVSVSIGAAIYPSCGTDYKTLLHNADCALYAAKKRGKDQFVVFDECMETQKNDD